MKKFHLLLIVLFGFLLMPSNAFACGNLCGNKTEKHSCKKETKYKTQKEDCCDNENPSKSKNHNGCEGKCGHAKCGCTTVTNGFTETIELNFKNNIFDFSTEKQKFYNTETFISSGFHSLWLIPKIS